MDGSRKYSGFMESEYIFLHSNMSSACSKPGDDIFSDGIAVNFVFSSLLIFLPEFLPQKVKSSLKASGNADRVKSSKLSMKEYVCLVGLTTTMTNGLNHMVPKLPHATVMKLKLLDVSSPEQRSIHCSASIEKGLISDFMILKFFISLIIFYDLSVDSLAYFRLRIFFVARVHPRSRIRYCKRPLPGSSGLEKLYSFQLHRQVISP